jgi:hypothetical protein
MVWAVPGYVPFYTEMIEDYIIKTVAAAAHLCGSCPDPGQIDSVMARATDMLNSVWTPCYKRFERETPPEHLNVALAVFWDHISYELVATTAKHVYFFRAIYGEEVNSPGEKGNVHISIQPNNSAHLLVTKLKLLSE